MLCNIEAVKAKLLDGFLNFRGLNGCPVVYTLKAFLLEALDPVHDRLDMVGVVVVKDVLCTNVQG